MIPRLLEQQVTDHLFRGRTIVLHGARRVGKTTLAKTILAQHPDKRTLYLNCDLLSVRRALEIEEATTLRAFLGDQDLVVLDEAQQVENIGRILKILVDEYLGMQVIATGSSSFDLVNQAAEPLTGRMYRFVMYPLALRELAGGQGYSAIEPRMDFLLRFGAYPSVVDLSEQEARVELDELTSNYLYRDVLAFVGIRMSTVLIKLLELLARQIGQEVSYHEVAQALGIDRRTVVSYISLLEQRYVSSAWAPSAAICARRSRSRSISTSTISACATASFRTSHRSRSAMTSAPCGRTSVSWNGASCFSINVSSSASTFGAPTTRRRSITWRRVTANCEATNSNGAPPVE